MLLNKSLLLSFYQLRKFMKRIGISHCLQFAYNVINVIIVYSILHTHFTVGWNDKCGKLIVNVMLLNAITTSVLLIYYIGNLFENTLTKCLNKFLEESLISVVGIIYTIFHMYTLYETYKLYTTIKETSCVDTPSYNLVLLCLILPVTSILICVVVVTFYFFLICCVSCCSQLAKTPVNTYYPTKTKKY